MYAPLFWQKHQQKFILFGSYARGECVEDYQDNHEYVSDYDILEITADRKTAKRNKKWRDLEAQLRDHKEITKTNIFHYSIYYRNTVPPASEQDCALENI